MQFAAHVSKNALHDLVAPYTASGYLVVAFFVFAFSGFQPCRIGLLGLHAVLIKNLARAQRILVEFIQQHIAESDGFVTGCILTPVLLVGEVAG